MKKSCRIIAFFLSCLSSIGCYAGVTIEECVEKAISNYPLVRKYGLMEATKEIELSDINKGWLPRVGIYAQATAQNVVPSFPETLTGVLNQMGQDVRGLGKMQYKLGVDVSQTIWDGGVSKAKRELIRSQDAISRASLDVELYSVRERVENIYFAVLLTEEQIAQCRVTQKVLENNLDKLRSMLRNGVAMQSDIDMVEAQSLELNQKIVQAQSALKGYKRVLELFIGESLGGKEFERPTGEVPSDLKSNRAELKLFDKRIAANQATEWLSKTSMLPKIGLFAQAYYGYPGFDYFQSMMNRNLSFNILAGVKISWDLHSLYTKKNISKRASVNIEDVIADKELFLFNSNIQTTSQLETIEGLKDIMREDGRIINLRSNVRKAAESQLNNGVIDATALLTKISDENLAELTAKFHEIQLIQEIYKLKYILDQ